jgi:NADH-quinone oxidoreductase subunit B
VGTAPLNEPVRVTLNLDRRYTLWVLNVGLACCAVEFVAASVGRTGLADAAPLPLAPGPAHADLLVVAGTLTDRMAPAVRRLYDNMPTPRFVLSFGACANTGGPYWDSYSVTKGVDQLIPVDVYVPGCPPRPEALLKAILSLQDRIAPAPVGGGSPDAASVTAPLVRRPGSA